MSSGVAERIDREALGDPALLASWRSLAELRSSPFSTPEWFRVSLEATPEEEPFAIAWRRDGDLCGVLPLVRVSRGPVKLLRAPGARRADWFTPACRPIDEAAMASACADLLRREGGWSALRLDRVDGECAWPQALAATTGGLALGPPRRDDVLPFIAFDERGYEGYLADRSRNFRSQLGRRRRRLEREHGLSFRLTERPQQLGADLDAFLRLHDERWQGRGGSSSSSPAARAHLRAFAAAALERGWLRLWIAEADGSPAAAWYGWRIGERYCYALAGLSERFEPLGLGTVMLGHTIEQAATEGTRVYDLMWGDEAYKRRFETGRRRATTWILSRPGPSRVAVSLGVRLAKAPQALPPGVRRRLKRARGAIPGS